MKMTKSSVSFLIYVGTAVVGLAFAGYMLYAWYQFEMRPTGKTPIMTVQVAPPMLPPTPAAKPKFKPKPKPKPSIEQRDLLALSLNVYHEARGEPIAGQRAVAEVTLKRARVRGTSAHREVYRPGQFSWTGQPRGKAVGKAWIRAQQVAKAALLAEMAGLPPFVDATHYHADYVHPRWARGMQRVATIGNHHFYRRA